MAFTPSFTISQSGDCKTITIEDSSGTGIFGWDGTPAVTDIDDATNTLTLDITYTSSDGTVVAYDTINLHSTFLTAGHSSVADLVFPLTCVHLKVDGSSIGTADDEFNDGIYDITYSYQKLTANYHCSYSILIDGQIKREIYTLLKDLAINYECDNNHEKEILDVIFIKTYYDSMLATASIGQKNSVLNQLYVLERLVEYGSNNTW